MSPPVIRLQQYASSGMTGYSELLAKAADELRELAARAPDIARELRRFADDLDRLRVEALRSGRTGSNEAA